MMFIESHIMVLIGVMVRSPILRDKFLLPRNSIQCRLAPPRVVRSSTTTENRPTTSRAEQNQSVRKRDTSWDALAHETTPPPARKRRAMESTTDGTDDIVSKCT